MVTGFGLALALGTGATGCRSLRSEVPPAKTFSGAGQGGGPMGFGSSPPAQGTFAGLPGGSADPTPGQYGTPAPGASNYGAPTSNTYGAPGTSNLASPPASALGSGAPASALPSVSDPTTSIPQSGTGSTGPAAGIGVGRAASGTPAGPSQGPFDR
jgi:hypothetical protein